MRLVLLALSRPLTIVIALIAVALGSLMAVRRMPVDIFPQVGDPAIYVAQPYGGMDPAQMEGYLTYYYEYHFLYITGIDHVESKSIQGAALMKLVFHQGTDMSQAMGETVGYVNRARAFMPPGTVPPFITRFDAGSVAVGLLVFSSPNRPPGEMQDFALNRVRPLSGNTVYLRDIGTIENGTDIITAYAHVNGKRTVYIPVTKRADASTLAVINRVKAALPDFKKAVPDDVDVRLEFDQSPFVT